MFEFFRLRIAMNYLEEWAFKFNTIISIYNTIALNASKAFNVSYEKNIFTEYDQ